MSSLLKKALILGGFVLGHIVAKNGKNQPRLLVVQGAAVAEITPVTFDFALKVSGDVEIVTSQDDKSARGRFAKERSNQNVGIEDESQVITAGRKPPVDASSRPRLSPRN